VSVFRLKKLYTQETNAHMQGVRAGARAKGNSAGGGGGRVLTV